MGPDEAVTSRDRSASPARSPTAKPARPPPAARGFKWKAPQKARDDDGDENNNKSKETLSRGYRNRSPPRRRDDKDAESAHRAPPSRLPERETHSNSTIHSRNSARSEHSSSSSTAPSKKSKPKPSASASSSEPLILVHVNDRLGTKAAIPCLASDSVRAFRAMVAARIGRAAHEVMVKRQGERPFKDALTLADYGVSSGVQLDLELETGD